MLKYLIPALLFVTVSLQAEDIDAGITKLSTDLSAAISKSGSKKISVIDFTDLEGRDSQLGRYLAEQLSVSLVNSAKDFVVMDRANLASILKEHKLTASGLVNPENARKLGQFAGVDAIVLGSITPFGDSLVLTAKSISTETTQVLGATKVTVARSKDIDSMFSPEEPKDSADTDATGSSDAGSKDYIAPNNGTTVFDNIAVEIVSFRPTTSRSILVVLKLTNRNKTNRVRVGLDSARGDLRSAKTFLLDDQGNVLHLADLQGIGIPYKTFPGQDTSAFQEMKMELSNLILNSGPNGYKPSYEDYLARLVNQSNIMFDIGIGQSTLATLNFSNPLGSLRTFRLQADIITEEFQRAEIVGVSLNSVMISGIQAK